MPAVADHVRTGNSVADLKQAILDNLYYAQGRVPIIATKYDWYMATAFAVRDRMMHDWIVSFERIRKEHLKMVAYLSAEFLIGPQLGINLVDLGDIRQHTKAALAELGVSLEEIEAVEPEPGLGNGGLGRLAACYMESMTTEEVPAIGYGIRYEFGLFKQEIRDGWQVEKTDKWLQLGTPWEIVRPERNYLVGFGGHTEQYHDEHGGFRVRWVPANMVKGVAHDIPIAGYKTEATNFLRLWVSHAGGVVRPAGLQ